MFIFHIQATSSNAAAPIPPATHIVTTTYFSLRRLPSPMRLKQQATKRQRQKNGAPCVHPPIARARNHYITGGLPGA